MLTATRYLTCSLLNGRFYVAHIGGPESAEVSYRTPEEVGQEMDETLDRAIDTLAELEAVQQESVTRALPFRLVYVAEDLEDEVRRRAHWPTSPMRRS